MHASVEQHCGIFPVSHTKRAGAGETRDFHVAIDVKPGDVVKKSQTLGHSGSTGLAGGDHLHFSMQVDGVQVNPVEWWDDHWIHDRIFSKLNP